MCIYKVRKDYLFWVGRVLNMNSNTFQLLNALFTLYRAEDVYNECILQFRNVMVILLIVKIWCQAMLPCV